MRVANNPRAASLMRVEKEEPRPRSRAAPSARSEGRASVVRYAENGPFTHELRKLRIGYGSIPDAERHAPQAWNGAVRASVRWVPSGLRGGRRHAENVGVTGFFGVPAVEGPLHPEVIHSRSLDSCVPCGDRLAIAARALRRERPRRSQRCGSGPHPCRHTGGDRPRAPVRRRCLLRSETRQRRS